MSTLRIVLILTAGCAVFLGFWLAWPSPIDAHMWRLGAEVPLENIGLQRRYLPDQQQRYDSPSPFSKFARCADGTFYFSDNASDIPDGTLIQLHPESGNEPTTILRMPNIMLFDVVCLSSDTLLLATMDGVYRYHLDDPYPVRVTRGANHQSGGFVTAVDITQSEQIVFIDASRNRWRQGRNMDNGYLDLLENRAWGSLYSVTTPPSRTQIVNNALVLPSDLTISNDGQYVFVAEPNRATIKRIPLSGPQTGQAHIVTDSLAGQPIGLDMLPDGRLVVLMFEGRNPWLERIYAHPLVAHTLAKLRSFFHVNFHPDRASVVVLDAESGEVKEWHSLDTDAPVYIASIFVDDVGHLWINRGFPAELIRLPLSQSPAHASE